MIQDPQHLRRAIQDAEAIAARVAFRGHHLSRGERELIATLLRDLAEVARRAFDPHARNDWTARPREPEDGDDVPGLFADGAA